MKFSKKSKNRVTGRGVCTYLEAMPGDLQWLNDGSGQVAKIKVRNSPESQESRRYPPAMVGILVYIPR
jgi:hypothetical protein